ncbi:hypothetical protein [Streptomyces chartreusis]|uniref:Uncharacterized protein n=1 Tax=Streptomyces chartreusis TaxID=1969 RepID=A0A7I0NTQ8_STRCX|nr:hypothetical protein [Streptomyces chartreusis]QKZ16451.1 hypothetical protein HUT05_03155 [Streptomyces chartreusis]
MLSSSRPGGWPIGWCRLFDDAERSFLLVGGDAVAADAVVEVPVMDDLAVFSGGVALNVDRAWALVHTFIQTGAPAELGEWCEL